MQNSKKFACSLCRRRKLKCDGQRPICMTCRRLGHSCTYDDHLPASRSHSAARARQAQRASVQSAFHPPQATEPAGILVPLGLQEPLPRQDIIDELHDIFFDCLHPFLPVLHRARYLMACQKPPNIGIPACLRYAVWSLAASVSQKYQGLEEIFYKRARSYAEDDELKGLGLSVLTVEHVQCWNLLSQYESQKMAFPRAWMGVGRAARLAQMLGLHQVDKESQITKRVLPPARDCIEQETRRRTFWAAFHNDRWATCGTGWPVTIDDREISTNLPSSEEAYLSGTFEDTPSLYTVRDGQGTSTISPFGGAILIADLIGRIREHLHFEPSQGSCLESEKVAFWRRHVRLDNDLSSLSLSLPNHLKLPTGVRDSTAVSINMNIHSLIISLHRAMIIKLEQSEPDHSLIFRSQVRCDTAAEEIVNILRLISHTDLNKMSPYTAFGLSVAATVFIPKAKQYGTQDESYTNLLFIRSVMEVLKTAHPITASFLLQLDLAMASSGLRQASQSSSSTLQQEEHSPTTSEPTVMAGELKKYDTLSISLDGILPTRAIHQESTQTTTLTSDRCMPAPDYVDCTGFDIQFENPLQSNWQVDDPYTAQQPNLDTSNPFWDNSVLKDDLGLDDANLEFLLNPLNLGASQLPG